MKRKIFFRWLKIIIILYCSIGIVLYYLQETFLFHPEKLDSNYKYHFNSLFEEINIPVNNIDTISLVKFFPPDSMKRKGLVLYFHGNSQNIERYAVFAGNFTKHGYEVWMEDYPGFGKSTGQRTEKKMNEEALLVEKLASKKYATDSIIIYGKSFGTGIAAYVASITSCRSLILETPYYSIPALFSCYAPIYPIQAMATYKMPVNEYLQDVKAPVSIFHGTDDGVVPYRCASKLKHFLKAGDEFITIEGGTHNNLNSFDLFHQKLDSLMR